MSPVFAACLAPKKQGEAKNCTSEHVYIHKALAMSHNLPCSTTERTGMLGLVRGGGSPFARRRVTFRSTPNKETLLLYRPSVPTFLFLACSASSFFFFLTSFSVSTFSFCRTISMSCSMASASLATSSRETPSRLRPSLWASASRVGGSRGSAPYLSTEAIVRAGQRR